MVRICKQRLFYGTRSRSISLNVLYGIYLYFKESIGHLRKIFDTDFFMNRHKLNSDKSPEMFHIWF